MKVPKILSVLLAGAVLATSGCALFTPMTPEERAAYEKRMAAQRAEAQRNQRLAENADGMEIAAADIYRVIAATEGIMRANGFATHTEPYKVGPNQAGTIVIGMKNQAVDLGTNLGMNFLAGALGASNKSIIKRHEQATTVWLWHKWDSSLTRAQPGVILYKNVSSEYDVNQADQAVNKRDKGMEDAMALRDGIQKAVR